MIRLLRVLHFVGVAAFLGSVFAHVSVGFIPGAADQPQAILFARQAIETATRLVTVPGLLLALASGLALTLVAGHGFGRKRWLTVHQAAAVLIALNAFLVLMPAGQEATAAARALAAGTGDLQAVLSAAAAEARFGPLNVMLALAAIALGVFRPRLGSRSA